MKHNLLLITIVTISAFSGCLGLNDEKSNSDNEEAWTSGLSSNCIQHDEIERCWDVYAPQFISPNYCMQNSCPLVFDLHGFGGTPESQKAVSGFDDLADEFGFVVVYPLGYENSWNSGWCCGEAPENDIDDVGLMTEITHIIESIWNTDSERRYVTGYSNGCSMTQTLANEASHFFTAAGCMALYFLEEPSPNYSPIPIMEVHGIRDLVIPYGNTYSSSAWFDQSLSGTEGAISNMEFWANMNECSGSTPDIEIFENDYSIVGYSQCENNTEVKLLTLHLAGHNPYKKNYPNDNPWAPISYGNPTGIDSSLILWDFLSQYSKNVTE